MDKEVEAIGKVLNALEPLTTEQRRRVISYGAVWSDDEGRKLESLKEKNMEPEKPF